MSAGQRGFRDDHSGITDVPYYISIGRAIPYKKLNLLVDTFNQSGKKLIVITSTDNALYKALKAKS